VPREELDSTAEALARRLLAQPQSALRMAKRLLAEGADLTLAGALDLEGRLASRLINA
jgi:enoyl-CoA hydratase/carnithine racemase